MSDSPDGDDADLSGGEDPDLPEENPDLPEGEDTDLPEGEDTDLPDSEDPNDGEQYHLAVGPGDVADAVLLPGDPERVEKIVEAWDDHELVAEHREFRTATGTYDGTPLSVTSTGIGSPSAAIAVEELARVGADTLLRVGSCGAIREEASVGDLVITTGAVRQEGTSKEYVREDYPAVADYRVVSALVAAAERLGHDYHLGVTCSTDSFYTGQSRPGFGGFEARDSDERLRELREAGVLNFEMEAASVLTLANVYGLRAGAVCTVYANRVTGEFRTEGERKAAETASLAVTLLDEMDRATDAAGADAWHPGLSLE
ncbi:MAG: nucleoside phosphorylase [Haloarculaceae archaeon]